MPDDSAGEESIPAGQIQQRRRLDDVEFQEGKQRNVRHVLDLEIEHFVKISFPFIVFEIFKIQTPRFGLGRFQIKLN